jgi:hypothetical protein
MKNVVLDISGLDAGVTKIQKIFIQSPDGTELTFSNIRLRRNNIFERSSVRIEKFILNNSSTGKNDSTQQLNALLPALKILRTFLADLSLEEGILNIAGKTYKLSDLHYQSTELVDRLSGKINRRQGLDIFFMWKNSSCHRSRIDFKNFLDFNGTLLINNPELDVATCELIASLGELKIEANGSYRDSLAAIDIPNAIAKFRGKVCKISGSLYLKNKCANFKASANLNDFTQTLPPEINGNFKNVRALFDVNCDFSNDFTGSFDTVISKANGKIGDLSGTFGRGNIAVEGDIGWIRVSGLGFEKIQCNLRNNGDLFLKARGEVFNLAAQAKIDKKILLQKMELTSRHGDYLSTTAPIELSKTAPYSFEFCFNRLDILKNILNISGDCRGKISVDSEKNSLSLTLSGKNIAYHDWNFRDVDLSLAQEQLNLSATINEDFSLHVQGECRDFCRRISLKTCSLMKSAKVIGKCAACDLDFINGVHKISLQLQNKHGARSGGVDVSHANNSTDINVFSLDTTGLQKLFRRSIPALILDGSLRLASINGFFVGEGEFSTVTPVTKKGGIAIKLKLQNNGVDLKVIVKRRQRELVAASFLPLLIRSSGVVQPDLFSNAFSCHISGDMELTDLLELTDKLDIRGSINGDMRISGSMANPVVSGHLSAKKMRIIVNDLMLKNGSISLSGDEGNNLILNGEFVDSNNHKLTIGGGGKLAFNGLMPNIETNMLLNFGNYKLFDTDNTTIIVVGSGKITGPIGDLLISGDVTIPSCKIQKFDSDEGEKKDEIIIENEIRIKKKSIRQEHQQENLFRFDIKAHCPKIFFSGRVFEMILRGNLHIFDCDRRLTMTGLLKLVEGRVDLFGKRMKMIRGAAEFLGEFPFDPKSRLSCIRNFGDILVYFDMENIPGSGLSFNLYSTPNYSKDIILSHMLFGKDLKYLSVSEAAQLAHVMASFSGHGYVFAVLNTFQNIGIIDNLSFSDSAKRSNSLNIDKTSNSEQSLNISAGKYVGDNVYISVNKNSEGASFDVDLSLTPKISLKANTAGEAGISWKYRY